MSYKAVNNVFTDGDVKNAGEVFELSDEQAKPLLERGSIVVYNPDEVVEEPATPELPGEVIEEFTVNEVHYEKRQEGGRNGQLHYASEGSLIDESAYTNAKQALTQQKLDAERYGEPKTEVSEVETPQPPLDPTPPAQTQPVQPAAPQLTPEQVEQDFQATGASSTPPNDAQLA